MKTSNLFIVSLILIVNLAASLKSHAQDWKWAINGYGTNPRTEFLATDSYNNSYLAVYYNDSLSIAGHSYFHEQWLDQYDCVLLKLDSKGTLLRQMDMYCPLVLNGTVRPLTMAADSAGNVFLAGAFAVRLFIGDTVINHLAVPEYEGPEAFLVKFDRNFDMKWAKVIGCEHYMYFQNMAIRNGHIYYSVNPHSWNSPDPITLYGFGQDTLYFPNTNENSVFFSLNLDGVIQSHKVIHGDNFGIDREITAENNHRYLLGTTIDTIFDGNKAVYIPALSGNWEQYLLEYDSKDSLVGTSQVKTNDNTYVPVAAINSQNELFFYMFAKPNLAIGNDTISYHYANTWVIGKLDAQRHMAWYETLAGLDNGLTQANLALLHDTLYATFDYSYYMILSDTTLYHADGDYENQLISFDTGGNKTGFSRTNTNGNSHVTGIGFDNCENILLSGTFQGKAFYGSDTLVSHYATGSVFDLFVAYFDRGTRSVELGPDKTVCGSVVLEGPAGWDHYSWNNGFSGLKQLTVTQSGQYSLSVWNDHCCFQRDSLLVTVLPKPVFSLGNDTLLKQSHTLVLNVPAGFRKYLWSTGDTLNSVTLKGSAYTPGKHQIWCEVFNASCSQVDSLMLDVVNDLGIPEKEGLQISIFPNPFTGSFRLSVDEPVESVEILDYSGKALAFYSLGQSVVQPVDLTFENNSGGLVLLRIRVGNTYYCRKVVYSGKRD